MRSKHTAGRKADASVDPDAGAGLGRRLARALSANRLPRTVRGPATFVAELLSEMRKDRTTGLAAEVAFYAILGVFPALLLVAAGVAWLDTLVGREIAEGVRHGVVKGLRRMVTERGSQAVAAVDQLFDRRATGVLTGAGAAALFAVSRSFASLIRALNIVNDTDEGRSWLRVRLMGLAMGLGSVVVAAVMIAVIVVGPLLGHGQDVASRFGAGDAYAFLWRWLRLPTAFVLLSAWAVVVLHVSPSRRRTWRSDVPGGLAAATAWVVVSWGFGAYLRVAGAANEVYGVLGGGLILLMWVYLLSMGLLLGGEINAERDRRPSRADGGDRSSS